MALRARRDEVVRVGQATHDRSRAAPDACCGTASTPARLALRAVGRAVVVVVVVGGRLRVALAAHRRSPTRGRSRARQRRSCRDGMAFVAVAAQRPRLAWCRGVRGAERSDVDAGDCPQSSGSSWPTPGTPTGGSSCTSSWRRPASCLPSVVVGVRRLVGEVDVAVGAQEACACADSAERSCRRTG